MLSIAFTLFIAGLLTILLPCILPLIPIVLGASITDKNRFRPLVTIVGMVVSFVGFTFLLQVTLSQFVEVADYIRIATFYVLLLFGLGFLFHSRVPQYIGAILGAVFFLNKGWVAVVIVAILGVIAMELGGRIATWIQQLGTNVQTAARTELGSNSLITALIIGLTMGLVWVPCAGPALGFALSVVRNEPGFQAFLYLLAYGLGAGLPLLAIGYGGQAAVHSVRFLSKYSGYVKQVSGVLLILCAIGFNYNLFLGLQTSFGLGTDIETALFGNQIGVPTGSGSSISSVAPNGQPSNLPVIAHAPEAFADLGTWHNSQPLDLKSLRGKVVLIDFWTYSCINCIRTLPYIQAYWDKYKSQPFVLIGVHTPEFTFEKSDANVAMAIKEHGLTYPIVQDNNFGTWNAFENHYWPAKYLIDAQGRIRYEHFGEGNYEETDKAIASLLAEIGHTVDSGMKIPTETAGRNQPITPETYLHSRGWASFGNAKGDPSPRPILYTLPDTFEANMFYLGGMWQLTDDERQVLKSDNGGELAIRALAGEVNLVMGTEDDVKSVIADVFVDGVQTQTLTIDHHDLYNLYKGEYGQHDVVLKFRGKGVSAYAYTFGS